MSQLLIRQFPCLSDNYGFLVHDPDSGETATIDSPDADRILTEAAEAGWTVTHGVTGEPEETAANDGDEPMPAATQTPATATTMATMDKRHPLDWSPLTNGDEESVDSDDAEGDDDGRDAQHEPEGRQHPESNRGERPCSADSH